MPAIDPRDFERALEGLDFPATRDGIVRTAADKGGINGHVLVVLADIADETYDTRDELDAAITAAMSRQRSTGPEIPAAPPDTRRSSA